MDKPTRWYPWDSNQIVKSLPGLIARVEPILPKCPEKDRSAIPSLKAKPPTLPQIYDGSRKKDLQALAFALESMGKSIDKKVSSGSGGTVCIKCGFQNRSGARFCIHDGEPLPQVSRSGNVDESLQMFQAAHELFRSLNHNLRPNKSMHRALNNALEVILNYEIECIKDGEIDAGSILKELKAFVISTWGEIPPQFDLSINEMMLTHLNKVRIAGENDTTFHERLVRDNIEAVLTMEVPLRLVKTQDRWQEICEHVAPVAFRTTMRMLKRPRVLSSLLSSVRARIQQAVEQADVEALGQALTDIQEDLKANLCLRLDAMLDYREPIIEIRDRHGQLDEDFLKAYNLLLQQDSSAIDKFRKIYHQRGKEPAVKQWYTYALSLCGKPTDIHDIIKLLEEIIESKSYKLKSGWTARWNLACALRRLPTHADEALDVLLHVLNYEIHETETFELCLLWALNQSKEDVLVRLLPKSSYYEAQLLAALYDSKMRKDAEEKPNFRNHFARINHILHDPDYVFPQPKENLGTSGLERIMRDFIDNNMFTAGIEWFSQHISYGDEEDSSKNWECAVELNEKAEEKSSAWRCRCRQLECDLRTSYDPKQKKSRLRSWASWAEQYDFRSQALIWLKEQATRKSLTSVDIRELELRLGKTPPPNGSNTNIHSGMPSGPKDGSHQSHDPSIPPVILTHSPQVATNAPLTTEEAEQIIQQMARSFAEIRTSDTLAKKAQDAYRFIDATIAKHTDISLDIVTPLREVIRLALAFQADLDAQQAQKLAKQMKDQLVFLEKQRKDEPYEITDFVRACIRVIRNAVTRLKVIPEINILPLESLKNVLDRPTASETFNTRIFVRLFNPGTEETHDIKISFTTLSSGVCFLEEAVTLASIAPNEKRVVEGLLEVSGGVEDLIEVGVHITYKSANIALKANTQGHVNVHPLGDPIPFTQRYMTHTPVSADRHDLFHGRDKELTELLAAFAGGKLLRLYFVNGIRRVGKSTLMYQLIARCDHEVLPLLLNLEMILADPNMNTVKLVRRLISDTIREVQKQQDIFLPPIPIPAADAFELESPWVIFDDFLANLLLRTQRKCVLICFDEVQRLVERIADYSDPIDESFLSWLRSKIQAKSNILVVCTGSEPYAVMRKRYERHTLWGNMEAYNVSFVEKEAMEKIATQPVVQDGVTWLPEALDRLWDMTEGHPWLTQILAEKVAGLLNSERRRLVGPGDVERAAELEASDERISDLWWNEREGMVTATHRQIAFLILQHQGGSRLGLPESQLVDYCQKSGIRTVGKHLEEMRNLEVLTEVKGDEAHWRMKGAFLEQHLTTLMHRFSQETEPRLLHLAEQPLALMLDWENVKIGLQKLLGKEPYKSKADSLRPRLNGAELANRLLDAASRHGKPRQKWAVANWDRFRGDQMALRNLRYMTDIAGVDKADASDHVLREKIHDVLSNYQEINSYIIGTGDADFGAVINTLIGKEKHVVLWTTRDSLSSAYKQFLSDPDYFTIEWLEDLIFEKESAD